MRMNRSQTATRLLHRVNCRHSVLFCSVDYVQTLILIGTTPCAQKNCIVNSNSWR